MSLCPLQHSLIAISSSWFSAKWMWSDPSPLCYTQPNLFTHSSSAFYLKLVQNLHCVLVSWRNCERNFKTYLIEIFGFAAQTVPHPSIHLSTHPRSNTISTSHYVGDTCHANEKGQGHVRPISSGEQFFTVAINTPPSLPHFFYSARPLSPARASQTLAPPLLHRRRWGRASLPRPRRRRTRADRGHLHSAAVVAVFLHQVRAWKICTDELHISSLQFVVFFVQGK